MLVTMTSKSQITLPKDMPVVMAAFKAWQQRGGEWADRFDRCVKAGFRLRRCTDAGTTRCSRSGLRLLAD